MKELFTSVVASTLTCVVLYFALPDAQTWTTAKWVLSWLALFGFLSMWKQLLNAIRGRREAP